MKCKSCKENTDHVIVVSEFAQVGYLKPRSRKIDYYQDQDDPFGQTLSIHCPNCGEPMKAIEP